MDKTITIPTVIQASLLVIGMVAAYISLKEHMTVAARSIDDHEQRIRTVETRILPALERMDQRLEHIERAVGQ